MKFFMSGLLGFLFTAACAAETFTGLPPAGEFREQWLDRNGQENAGADLPAQQNRKKVPEKDNRIANPGSRAPAAESRYRGLPPRTATLRRRGRILRVGPGKKFSMPSAAAAHARDGDTIEIDARGNYRGDEVIWRSHNLRIRGVGGRPLISAQEHLLNGKALWVIQGGNTTVENIEFAYARVKDGNAAGIRLEGRDLQVLYCNFHHNQNGILVGGIAESHVRIEYSEFAYNGSGDGRTHNVYIGRIGRLHMRFNSLHHARIGHNIKSRARQNFMLYNRVMDENDGSASYQVDIPDGGFALLMGNIIQQGPEAENRAMMSYGTEGMHYSDNALLVINNTIVNDRHDGQFLNIKNRVKMQLVNNIFAGKLRLPGINSLHKMNLIKTAPRFVNRDKFDYHLQRHSAAIDKGLKPVAHADLDLIPLYEYMHSARAILRNIKRSLDYGAFEYRK